MEIRSEPGAGMRAATPAEDAGQHQFGPNAITLTQSTVIGIVGHTARPEGKPLPSVDPDQPPDRAGALTLEGVGAGAGRPVIGLTSVPSTVRYADTDLPSYSIADAYIQAVWAAGGLPVALTAAAPPAAAAGYAAALDGLILTGGGDVDPARYGQPRDELTGSIVPARDAFEIELARLALARDLPVFAICRGIQVLNVACGGSLVQDLVTAGRDPHRRPTMPPVYHDVTIGPRTLLAAVTATSRLRVNSIHHQSVRRVGRGLRQAAVAPDGTVESVERREPGWVLGVQWHPELMYAEDPAQFALFRALVDQARAIRFQPMPIVTA
jgi:putative glutamine amidotransferase